MIQIFKIDENGYWVPAETTLIKKIFDNDGNDITTIPEGFTDVPLTEGLFKAQFKHDKEKWVEAATSEEIEAIRNRPREKSPIELLQEENELLGQMATDSELESMSQGQIITELELQNIEQGQQMTGMELRLLELEAK